MNIIYDMFGQAEVPIISLCNPDGKKIYALGIAYNRKVTLRFNALSEFEFDFPESVDGGITAIEAYYYLSNKRLINIENFGVFQIDDVKESLTGSVAIKHVTAKAIESELINKKLTSYAGTKMLYNTVSPTGTLLQDIISLIPNWTISYVDPLLLTNTRTFSVSDSSIYQFLMGDVSSAFNCVFVFDSFYKTISAYSVNTAVQSTNIILTFDNLLKSLSFSEKSDEITTCLSVYGGGDLDIHFVNPLGTNKIYNFDYYANTNWMSQGLITALSNWKISVSGYQAAYANNLTYLRTANAELITLTGQLDTLNSEYSALEQVKAARIQAGLPYGDITAQLNTKQTQINQKITEINNKNTQINGYKTTLQNINNYVSFSNYFTPTQLNELNNFIFENTYQNENIIITDIMTDVEIQDAAQSLYNQGLDILSKVSKPRYEIEVDSTNFAMLEEYSEFTKNLKVGAKIKVEIKDSAAVNKSYQTGSDSEYSTATAENSGWVDLVLLEIYLNFDDPSDFKLSFSNRLRLDNGSFVYSDLLGQTVKTGSTVSFQASNWDNWQEHKDDVTTFITSALDAATNNLISNSNQELKIDQTGLRGRKYNPSTGTYYNQQVWLTNNVLAFSDDGFTTSKLALGQITTPSGGTAYGIVGEVIVGNLIAGNNLTIKNSNNSFIVDATGATLTNAKFSINTTNTKIVFDPTSTYNFFIQKNEGGSFVNKFWVDNAGNVNFAGNLSGATGTFSGALSGATGTFSGSLSAATGTFAGSLSAATGTFRGQLQAATGTFSGDISAASGTFSGNIYANKIYGEIVDTQIGYGLNAEKVTFGTMSADRIYGGVISWSGATMGSLSSGSAFINANSEIELNAGGDAYILIEPNLITMSTTYSIDIYATTSLNLQSGDSVYIYGDLWTRNRAGTAEGFGVTGTVNSTSYHNFVFVNGILVDYY